MSTQGLVVGASGQVGAEMLRYFGRTRGVGYALPTCREPAGKANWLALDLVSLGSAAADALLRPYHLNSIYCVAGMTDVERCETEPAMAKGANARGPAVLAAYARRLGLPFVYFSTEYVFDGHPMHPGPYAEDAQTGAVSVYGQSKLDGERAVRDAHPDALIVRTTVVYGEDARGKNYLYSLMRNLGAGRSMRVPADQISTPTYNRDLVRATVGLVDAGATGVFHLCGPELLSRIDFARRIAEFLELDASLLEPVPTASLGQRAARPLEAGLLTEKLRQNYPELRMRTLEESLRDCEGVLRQFLHDVRQQAAECAVVA